MQNNQKIQPIVMTDNNIHHNIKTHPLLVIDCWAPWCGPCRMIEPIINQLSYELRGKAMFGKLNVDDNDYAAEKYKIMSIPTILIFKDGTVVRRMVGMRSKSQLLKELVPYIKEEKRDETLHQKEIL